MRRKQSILVLLTALFFCGCIAGVALAGKCNEEPGEAAARFAVEHRDGKKRLTFSDAGCALAWRDKQCTSRQMVFDATAKVRDYATASPVPIAEAVFVVGSDIVSPAGHEVVAFASRQEAEKFAAEHGGRLMDYESLAQESFAD